MYVYRPNWALSDWLTSRPEGSTQPTELWLSDILMYTYMNNHVHCALQSIEKEIEKKQNQERNTKLFTHIHTTASTA